LSTTETHPHGYVTIYISRSAIRVEDEKVAAVDNGEADASSKRWARNGSVISPLLSALQKHVTRLKKMEVMTRGKFHFEAALELRFDHTTPFSLVSEVLLTAREAGFGKFSLLTNTPGPGRGLSCKDTASLVFKIPGPGHGVSLEPCSFICGQACRKAEASRRRARLMSQASKLAPPQGSAMSRETAKSNERRRPELAKKQPGPRPHLRVAISISRQGFTVSDSGEVVPGPAGNKVSIPCKGSAGGRCSWKPTATWLRDNYEYEELHKMLARLKRKLPKERCVSVTADSRIPLQVVVRTLDAARGRFIVNRSGVGGKYSLFGHVVVIPGVPGELPVPH
jgi:biopolymer transport protein ExbD